MAHGYGEAGYGEAGWLDYGYGEDGWADDYDHDQYKVGYPDADAEKLVDDNPETWAGTDAKNEWDDISGGIASAVANFLQNSTFDDEA